MLTLAEVFSLNACIFLCSKLVAEIDDKLGYNDNERRASQSYRADHDIIHRGGIGEKEGKGIAVAVSECHKVCSATVEEVV